MGVPAVGTVVLVRFPFSDLSETKLRPAVVVADADRGDVVLCQITSRPYGDVHAERLTPQDFATGRLPVESFARPAKLFTAQQGLIVSHVGMLTDDARRRVIGAVVRRLQPGL